MDISYDLRSRIACINACASFNQVLNQFGVTYNTPLSTWIKQDGQNTVNCEQVNVLSERNAGRSDETYSASEHLTLKELFRRIRNIRNVSRHSNAVHIQPV